MFVLLQIGARGRGRREGEGEGILTCHMVTSFYLLYWPFTPGAALADFPDAPDRFFLLSALFSELSEWVAMLLLSGVGKE